MALNTAYVVAQVFYGLAAHSLALLADAGHNLGDVLGLGDAWLAAVLIKRRPTGRYTYGLGGTSILAALGNAVLLLVVTGGIAWEAIRRLTDPQPAGGTTIMVVAAAGILVNGIAPGPTLTDGTRMLFYGEDGRLSLKFSATADTPESERVKSPALRGTSDTPPVAATGTTADGVLGRIDLIKVLSESSARARRGERASAYLRGVGLRSATVIIDNGSRKSVWRVPELDIDLDHKRSRSSIAGRARHSCGCRCR